MVRVVRSSDDSIQRAQEAAEAAGNGMLSVGGGPEEVYRATYDASINSGSCDLTQAAVMAAEITRQTEMSREQDNAPRPNKISLTDVVGSMDPFGTLVSYRMDLTTPTSFEDHDPNIHEPLIILAQTLILTLGS